MSLETFLLPGLDFVSSRIRLGIIQLDCVSTLHSQPLIYIYVLPVNSIGIFADSSIISHQSQCQLLMNVSLLAETLMVCPYFYPSTLVLISCSTPWSIWWKGCSSCQEFCLHNAQPDSYFPSTYAKFWGQTPCRQALWSGQHNTLA